MIDIIANLIVAQRLIADIESTCDPEADCINDRIAVLADECIEEAIEQLRALDDDDDYMRDEELRERISSTITEYLRDKIRAG